MDRRSEWLGDRPAADVAGPRSGTELERSSPVTDIASAMASLTAPTLPVTPQAILVAPGRASILLGAHNLLGGAQDDQLTGTQDVDVIVGFGGADGLQGLGRADRLAGRVGNDTPSGRARDDNPLGERRRGAVLGATPCRAGPVTNSSGAGSGRMICTAAREPTSSS